MSTVLNMIELRDGSAVDLALVDTVMAKAFNPRFGEAWSRNQCLGILALPGVSLTIATLNGEPAGFALSRQILDEVELLLLATAPAMRRCGIGRALLRSVVTHAISNKATMVHLEVREGNEAIKLYKAAGFVNIGERRNYYRGATGQVFNAFTFSRGLT